MNDQIDYTALLTKAISFVFSWLVLMPISVIVSGKLLAQIFYLRGAATQLFRIHIPPVLDIHANDDEVILGFTEFIICLLLIGLPLGPIAYLMIKRQFGIDPGQFNALCVLSAFVSVVVAATIYLIKTQAVRRPADATTREYERMLRDLTKAPTHDATPEEETDDQR